MVAANRYFTQGRDAKMLDNASCTVYHRIRNDAGHDTWQKVYVPECWWFCDTKSSVTDNGTKTGDILYVRIFDMSVPVNKDDVIVKGYCPVDMTTLKDLSGYRYFKITSANHNDFGGNPHIKVVAV